MGGSEARPLARRVFNFDNNDLAQAREEILEFGVKLSWEGGTQSAAVSSKVFLSSSIQDSGHA